MDSGILVSAKKDDKQDLRKEPITRSWLVAISRHIGVLLWCLRNVSGGRWEHKAILFQHLGNRVQQSFG